MQPAMCLQCLDILNTKKDWKQKLKVLYTVVVDCQQWSKAIQLGSEEAVAFK